MKPEDLGRMRLGDDALDPEATNRLWTGIGSRRRSLVVRRRAARAGAVLAGAALAAVLLAGRAGPLRSFLPPPATAASAGPLRRLGGAPLEMLTATAPHSALARRMRLRCPSCRKPMVGTRPTGCGRRRTADNAAPGVSTTNTSGQH